MEHILNQLKELQRAVLEDNELMALQAQLMKKMYDELTKVGFTAQEAIQIVAAQGAGIKANG